MPDTDSVSSVIEVMSASVFWVLVATSRRARPTLTVSQRKIGIKDSESSVSCHDSTDIAMIVLAMTTTFAKTLEAVSVTTDCTPPTSFARRDWISPVRVVVKNRSGMNCRCEYNEFLRSCMTRSPTRLARYVWPIPMVDVTIGIATMKATPKYRECMFGHAPASQRPGGLPNRAWSKTHLMSSGFTTPSPDVSTIAPETTTTCARYGRKILMTRRTVCFRMGR